MTANVQYEVEQRRLLRNSHCLSAISDSLHLQFKLTIGAQSYSRKHTNCTTRFKNVIFRHHYVMQKNSSSIETEQRYLCRVNLHFNRQNLMLITHLVTKLQLMALIENIPLNIKNSMRCAKKCFFILLVTAIRGRSIPERCFLPGQLRLTPKELCGDSLSGRGSTIQPSK